MIVGTGIDIIEIERIRQAIERNDKFLNKIFDNEELKYIAEKGNSIQTIAGMFAAKEAIGKALGYGIREYQWQDIIIKHDELGKPYAELKRKADLIAKRIGIVDLELTISHLKENAMAIAVASSNVSIIKDPFIKPTEAAPTGNFKPVTYEMVNELLPLRDKDSHKGTYGRVGVMSGCVGMTGATYLSGMGALRSGAGLVFLIVPKSIANVMEIKCTEPITRPSEDLGKGHFSIAGINEIKKAIDEVDLLLIGPGVGVDKERAQVIKEMLLYTRKPVVLDADGLNCIKDDPKILLQRDGYTVITPHPGELATLLGVNTSDIQADREMYALKASKMFKVITVLKGNDTIICDPEGRMYKNTTGNPGMATAGSGDILSGIIASFIGQRLAPLQAAIAGVYVHGLAGDFASYYRGEYGTIASDILERVPDAISYTLKNKIQY